MDLRLPNITATNPNEKIDQLQRYIYQLVNDLNFIENNTTNQLTDIDSRLKALEKNKQ